MSEKPKIIKRQDRGKSTEERKEEARKIALELETLKRRVLKLAE
jgi:hypothetical protein